MLLAAALIPVRATAVLAQQRDEPLVFIIASSTGISDIPADVLRTSFLGLSTEYHGVRLVPFNMPLKTLIRERLDRALLGLEPSEVGNFWVNQRVRDGRRPPRTAPSLDLAVRVVAQLPGAIACVPVSAVEPRVRALRIDGKSPSEKGYLLDRK